MQISKSDGSAAKKVVFDQEDRQAKTNRWIENLVRKRVFDASDKGPISVLKRLQLCGFEDVSIEIKITSSCGLNVMMLSDDIHNGQSDA